jgi:tripartite-type tricarboxylate transporter receptor subunit TctC
MALYRLEASVNKRLAFITGTVLLATIVATVGCTPKTEPATPAEFYKDKTIEVVVPHEVGNMVDVTARIIVPYLSRDTGANVVVNNMEGASGLEGINYVYRSQPDGLTLGFTTPAKFVPNKVLDEPAAEYELEQFSYIMSIGCRLYYFMVSTDGPYQSAADLQAATDLKIGGGSPSGPISLGGLTAIKLLGLDAKVITGIRSEADRSLATKRGEIAGYFQTISAAKSSIDAGMIKPLFVLATKRDALMPDVPAVTELADLSDEDLALAKLWETVLVGSNVIFAPPGLPEDRLAFLRNSAENWAQDEAFCQEMNTVAGYEVQVYATGEEVSQSMLEMASSLDDFQAIFNELIELYRA